MTDIPAGKRWHSDNLRLEAHEAICAERYQNILDKIDGAISRIGRLEMLVIAVAGSTIIGMAGLIITLAMRTQ